MGDHCAEVKVEMTLHGKTYKQHWNYINWDIYAGIDQRVTKWFNECSQDALRRFDEKMAKAEAKARANETEAVERAELARLKAKYEP